MGPTVARLAFVVGGGMRSGAYGAMRCGVTFRGVVHEQVAFPTLSVEAEERVFHEVADMVNEDESSNTMSRGSVFAWEGEDHKGVSLHDSCVGGGGPAWHLAEGEEAVGLTDSRGYLWSSHGDGDAMDKEFELNAVGRDVGDIEPE